MRRWICSGLLAALLPMATFAELESTSGTVEQVTRVATVGAESEPLLLVHLVEGGVFAFPGIDHLPAGSGVELEIDYQVTDDPGRVPEACAARLLGLPLMIDGEEVMQSVRRPISIFVSDSEACL